MSLALYAVPGVVIGGTLAPMLSERLDKQTMERFLPIIFLVIGGLAQWMTGIARR